ncbi:hypothetical protein RFI_30325 [Reticulomyxa filosa]|uniref:Uncharacterized protein n=1 Tax=Reticulomyxa filosa TaxID=46433 RepID=X6M0X9_RETFI|nr:hypothetical protein RFI_30325 [Reticulomyxa filosa]|eukprot:ETO07067.1 hypothetical protein RFI_30325 [Reticulomyxa filosa]
MIPKRCWNWTSIDWNGLIAHLLQIIGNEKMTNIEVLTETIKLLDAIVTKQKDNTCLSNLIDWKFVNSYMFSKHGTKTIVCTVFFVECFSCFIVAMETIRFYQQSISILKAPKTDLLICELIKRYYHRFVSQGNGCLQKRDNMAITLIKLNEQDATSKLTEQSPSMQNDSNEQDCPKQHNQKLPIFQYT